MWAGAKSRVRQPVAAPSSVAPEPEGAGAACGGSGAAAAKRSTASQPRQWHRGLPLLVCRQRQPPGGPIRCGAAVSVSRQAQKYTYQILLKG